MICVIMTCSGGKDKMTKYDPEEIEFHENRVAALRRQVNRWYNAHRDAVDELNEAERQLRICRRG